MTDNPYASPATDVMRVPASTNRLPFVSMAKDVFLTWEKLRIVYVVILTIVTLLLAGLSPLSAPQLMVSIGAGAVIANILYFAGPIIETYVRWLGYDQDWPRYLMFIGGTLLSMFLAEVILMTDLLK